MRSYLLTIIRHGIDHIAVEDVVGVEVEGRRGIGGWEQGTGY
jgi:hypothetical protein